MMENVKVCRLLFLSVLLHLICDLVSTAQLDSQATPCKDTLGLYRCQVYNRLKACSTHPHRMRSMCAKTCGFCDGRDLCKDIFETEKCEFLKWNGVCYSHANLMQKVCAKTCDACDTNYKCSFIRCPKQKFCTVSSKGEPYCECPRYCDYEGIYNKMGEVCGTDGKTYKNYCELMKISCEENRNINIYFYGKCLADIPCQDSKLEKESGLCGAWKQAGVCEKHQGVLEKYCPRTCGFCPQLRAQAPAKCHSTKYGCCWDDRPAKSPSKKDCRKCKDRYPSLCIAFIWDCKSKNVKNRQFMRSNCPATCRFCHTERTYNSVTSALLRYHKAIRLSEKKNG